MRSDILRRLAAVLASAAFAATIGCGGGGGAGTTPADVQGRVLLVTTGAAPNPAATVTVAGAASVQTAADGTFVIRSAASTATQISITATGMTALTQPLPTLKANAVNDLGDIFLTDQTYNANVDGRVVRADTLAPIAGAKVRLSGHFATTPTDGTFAMTGLPVGLGGTSDVVGVITATGLEDKNLVLDLPLGATAPPTNLVNHLGDILVSPPVGGIPGGPTTIRGKITRTGTADYAGTTVTLIRNSDAKVLGSVFTITDGSYGFWVVAGAYTVKAEHPGFVTQTKVATLVKTSEPVTVDLNLAP